MFDATVQVFKKSLYLKVIRNLKNDNDLFVYPSIPDSVIHELRSNFQLHIDEVVLYVRDTSFWNDRNQGVVVTDWGISCLPDNDSMDELLQIPWEKVHHVEYSGQCLYFFYSESRNDNSPIHISHFLKDTGEGACEANGKFLCSIFNEMARTQMLENTEDVYNQTAEMYNKLMEKGAKEEALRLALNYRKERNSVGFTPQIAQLYWDSEQREKAIDILDEDINALSEDNLYWKSVLYSCKYNMLDEMGDKYNARKDCLYVIKNATSDASYNDINLAAEAVEDFKAIEKEYVGHFLELPYQARKLIVPVKSYSDLSQQTLSVLDIKNLPAIRFPIGHPIANQLYVGHPYIPSRYIPFEHYELELIEDKIREFCQIAQYLGATEINIECANSMSNNKDSILSRTILGGLDYKLMSAYVNSECNQSKKFLEDISQSINLHQRFSPKTEPVLPPNLVWYPNEPSWQRLYDQRMQGAIIEHEERIETKKSQVVENSQLTQIAAEVKWLFIEAKGNWEQSMEEKFEAHENAVLSIHIKFAPLEGQQRIKKSSISTQSLVMGFTSEEEEYLEEVKACLKDSGEISPRERRLLEKLSAHLNISEKRARELEETLFKAQVCLTSEEEEYRNEYRNCLEEGVITSRERRLLDKLRFSLGISEERAKEIECMNP